MAYFVRDNAGWNTFTKSPNGVIGKYFRRKGFLLEQLAKKQVGKKTRQLYKSIHSTTIYSGTGFLTRVGSDNKIARIHHDGTKAHKIFPKRAKTLRFHNHGKIVFAKVVNHPGTKPNRYLTDNLKKVI